MEDRIFNVSLEYSTGAGDASTFNFAFKCVDEVTAIKGIGAWWNRRNTFFPEQFKEMLAVNISQHFIGRLEENGILEHFNEFPFFVWKIDGGSTYRQQLDIFIARQARRVK